MTVDCFIFYNELDMLEFRLEELDRCVDYFVVVEATVTHSGLPKPLFFKENRDRFQKFLHKIVHVVVDDIPLEFDPIPSDSNLREYISDLLKYPKPPYSDFWTLHINRSLSFPPSTDWRPWVREWMHRQGIMKGVDTLNLKDSDVIMVSDVDEIPEADLVEIIANNGSDGHPRIGFRNSINGLYGFIQRMYYYDLECRGTQGWIRPKVMNYGTLKEIGDADAVRLAEGGACINSFYGGWHFSYFGGVDQIIKKVQGFSHQEYNHTDFLDKDLLRQRIENHVDVFGRDRGELGVMWQYIPFDITDYWPNRVDLLIKLFNLKHKL